MRLARILRSGLVAAITAAAVVGAPTAFADPEEDWGIPATRANQIRNTAPPLASFTASCGGCIANSDITGSASASDSDGTITRLDIYDWASGKPLAACVPATPVAIYSCNYSIPSPGPGVIKLAAYATDNLGVRRFSPLVILTLVNQAPVINSWITGCTGACVAPATVNFSATVSDGDGTVSLLEFLANGTVVGTINPNNSAPTNYNFGWSNAPAGVQNLSVRVTDNNGGVTTSATSQQVNVLPACSAPVVSPNPVPMGTAYTATASCTPVGGTYEWKVNSTVVPGVTGPTLNQTAPAAPQGMSVSYRYTVNGVFSDQSTAFNVIDPATGCTTTPVLSASPGNVDFGSVRYGVASNVNTVTLTNSGSCTIALNNIAMDGPADFMVSGRTCGTSLAVGASCTVSMLFIPGAVGARGSRLAIANSTPVSPLYVPVYGLGLGNVPNSPSAINIDRVVGGAGNSGTVTPAVCSIAGSMSGISSKVTCVRRCVIIKEIADFCRFECDGNPGSGWPAPPVDPTLPTGVSPGTGTPGPREPKPNPKPQLEECPDEGGSGGAPVPTTDIAGGPSGGQCVGDPIDSGSGNKAHLQTDYVGNGVFGVVFSRTYNSLATTASAHSRVPLGVGWTASWDNSVVVNSINTEVRVTRGDGKSFVFTQNSGAYSSTADVVSKLVRLTDTAGATTGWTHTLLDNSVENYDAQGRLTSFTLRTGQAFTVTYDAASRPVSIKNPVNRELKLQYDAKGRLSKLIDPANAETLYTYDTMDRLIQVTYADGRTRQYKYENGTYAYALTSIVDGAGTPFATFTYDADGRAASSVLAGNTENATVTFNGTSSTSTDAGGKTTQFNFVYNAGVAQMSSMTESCTGCISRTTSYTYTADGQIASKTDPRGIVTNYTYDARKLIASVTEAAGTPQQRVTTYTWHATFRLPTQIAGPTRTVSYTYDSAGRKTQETVSATGIPSRTTTYTYNAQGLLASVNGPRTDVNDVTTYTYDAAGNMTSSTNAVGHVTQYLSYDANGRLLSMKDPNGQTTSYTYDAMGRVLTTTSAGRTTTNTYDNRGLLTSTTDPEGVVTTYLYDSAHRQIGYDARGEKVRHTLDAMGRITRTETFDASNVLSAVSQREYDGFGRVKRELGQNGQVTTYTYDANGNVTSTVDALNNTIATSYDALNRPILITDPRGGNTNMTYNVNGELTGVTAPNGAVTTYTVNTVGDQTAENGPDRGNLTMTYNAAGQVITQTDARGKQTTYQYDAIGRLTQTTFADGSGISSTFDVATNGVARLSSMTDPSGSTSYTYDANGRTATRTVTIAGKSFALSYARDAIGRITAMTYPSGKVLSYTYGTDGRLSAIKLDGQNVATGIGYFPMGGPESWVLGSGATYLRDIDLDGRIKAHSMPGGTRTLTFDAASRITQIADSATATQTFGYDQNGRLTSFSGFTSAGAQTQSFTYDANGNRLTAALNGSLNLTYGYTANSNRLNSVTGYANPLNFTYDSAGNATTVGSLTLTYDARGRMSRAQGPFGNSVGDSTYLYNVAGQRVKKTVAIGSPVTSTQVSHFVYDDTGHMLGEYDANGAPVQELIWLAEAPVAIAAASVPGVCQAAPAVTTSTANQPLTVYNDLEGMRARAGDNSSDWEWSVGTSVTSTNNTNSTRRSQNWVSGKAYTYALTYTSAGKAVLVVKDGATALFTSNFPASGTTGPMRVGNALRLQLTRASGAPSGASASMTLTNIVTGTQTTTLTQTLTRAATTTGTVELLIAGENLRQGFTANGTLTFTFGSTRPTGDHLRFDVNVGNKLCNLAGTAYIYPDHLNTPRAVVNSANTKIWSWESLPFGDSVPNDNPSSVGKFTFNHRFPGQYYDSETGLHQNWHRDYHPAIGRYVQTDPVGLSAGVNTYLYAFAAPSLRGDPAGLDTYICVRPLNRSSDRIFFGQNDFQIRHQYFCVEQEGRFTCGGLTASGNPLSSPGRITTPADGDVFNADKCEKISTGNACYDACVLRELASTQLPNYQAIPVGSGSDNCQTFSGKVAKLCKAECSGRGK